MFLTSSYSKGLAGGRNKSEVGAGGKRRWTELVGREKKESPSHWEWPWHRCVRPTHREGWTECDQDYQLHVSCYQDK